LGPAPNDYLAIFWTAGNLRCVLVRAEAPEHVYEVQIVTEAGPAISEPCVNRESAAATAAHFWALFGERATE